MLGGSKINAAMCWVVGSRYLSTLVEVTIQVARGSTQGCGSVSTFCETQGGFSHLKGEPV